MKKSTIVLIASLFAAFNYASAQRVTVTMAGSDIAGYSGDGGSGKFAHLNAPYDICVDAMQNIYFTDNGNGRVRKISALNGVITTVAGGGTSTADGIPATNASITPRTLCIDAGGNLYIVCASTHQIKRVDAATNIITTIAGTGVAGFSGDGGPAIAAAFNDIFGICTDAAGNIYVVDQGNNRIRKIAAGTGIVTTIAGTGAAGYTGDGGPAIAAQLEYPFSITLNPAGDIFFMDQTVSFNSRLRKISAATGIITTIAGGTSAYPIYGSSLLNTWFGYVTGLCMTSAGDFYCNEISCSCRKIDTHTDTVYPVGGNFYVESFADNKNADLAYMNNPYGIAIDNAGNLYSADNLNNRIRKIIQLTNTPTYAYGRGQLLTLCSGAPTQLDSLLSIVDIDSMQTETWTVLSGPAHGSLSGFPATAVNATPMACLTKPAGTSYSLSSSYSGMDSFKIQVSDGTLSSVFTVYISAQNGSITGPDNICATGTPVTFSDAITGGAWSFANTNATVSSAGVVTGALPGSDVLTYTANTNCGIVTYTKTVNIDSVPPVSAGTISAGESLCAGATMTLTESLTGGAWSMSNADATITSAGVVTGVSGGSVNAVYTLTNGCGSASASATINIVPLPYAGTITGAATVCEGSEITLADVAPGGTWTVSNSRCTVVSPGLIKGISAGYDTVIYTVTNMCGTATTSQLITINKCHTNGIAITAAASVGISVFPNPASSMLNIEWGMMPSKNASVRITDITGRTVLSDEMASDANGSGSLVENLAELKDGVYLLSITSGSVHYTDKLVIAR